jgi:hypothetical protein
MPLPTALPAAPMFGKVTLQSNQSRHTSASATITSEQTQFSCPVTKFAGFFFFFVDDKFILLLTLARTFFPYPFDPPLTSSFLSSYQRPGSQVQ